MEAFEKLTPPDELAQPVNCQLRLQEKADGTRDLAAANVHERVHRRLLHARLEEHRDRRQAFGFEQALLRGEAEGVASPLVDQKDKPLLPCEDLESAVQIENLLKAHLRPLNGVYRKNAVAEPPRDKVVQHHLAIRM